MGLIRNAIQKRSNLANPDPWMLNIFRNGKSKTGVNVNEMKAMQSTAVFGCVRVISETLGSLSFPVYRRLNPRGKERARDHHLYDMLQNRPNNEMTAFTFRETMTAHLCLWGNAYAEIEYDGAGRPRALWPLLPNQTWPERDPRTKEIFYHVTLPDGRYIKMDKARVLHIPGLSMNGLTGLSPIGMAREAVGLALATEEFGANFFENGTNVGAVAEHPGKLSEQGAKNLRDSVNATYSGLGKSHRLMLLEEGMKFQKIGIPPNDAQFLETRKFQKNEIASVFRVPPHMLADLERATFSNIEHQSIEFVTHTMGPWLKRWEQTINTKLFGRDGRKHYFAEFLVDALLRGDIKTRYEAYAVGRQNGWLSANDILEMENKNPIGEQGDVYLVPLNMVPAEQVTSTTQQNDPAEPPSGERSIRSTTTRTQLQGVEIRKRTTSSYKRIFEETFLRIIKREEADIMRQARKQLRNAEHFSTWLSDFYREHEQFFRQQMLPVMMSFAENIYAQASNEVGSEEDEMTSSTVDFIKEYVELLSSRHNGKSVKKLRKILESEAEDAEIEERLQETFDDWKEDRIKQEAKEEVTRAGSAIAKEAWVVAGITLMRWVSDGSSCPYCEELDGKVVGIKSSFVQQGEDFNPENAEGALTPSSNISHPPLHNGCECSIAAEAS
ncbi:phage portal protein [Alteribacillus sp. YIM 98480]|uniref:phage portal protein n=1 Tax=Alteribacillus sp. YIM 98480 TaxID=2606599 RepID=UPI00131D40C2|nr:phage portal protein [Alteribacillus sp. YIM 98480]